MTKRDRLMLMAVAVLALIGGFWMFVLKPQRTATADAQAQVATAQSTLTDAQQKVTTGRRAQQAFRRDRTAIVKLGRVVPETDDIPTLLTQLEALGRRERVSFTAYNLASGGGSGSDAATGTTPKEATPEGSGSTAAVAPLFPPGSVEIEGGLGRTPIEIELRGTYFHLEKFLRTVQRFAVFSQRRSTTNGRLLVVDGFSYKGASEDEGGDTSGKASVAAKWSKQPRLTATLTASVYFAPPLDAPSASAAGSAAPAGSGTPSTSTSSSSTGTATIGGVQ